MKIAAIKKKRRLMKTMYSKEEKIIRRIMETMIKKK